MLKFICDFCGKEYKIDPYGYGRGAIYKMGKKEYDTWSGRRPCHCCQKEVDKAEQKALEEIKKRR